MSNRKISLRRLTARDSALLSKIAIRAYSDHYLHLWFDRGAWYIAKCFSISNLKKELSDRNALFFLISDDKESVGFMKINQDKAFEGGDASEALELERIYLTGAASGKGIGSFLMRWLMAFAMGKNKKVIWLKVMDSSAGAIQFYKKNGFTICGESRLDFIRMKEEFRGMFLMKRNLEV